MLDEARLVELRALFPGDELDGLLEDIAAAIATDVEDIDKAVIQGDREAVAAAAHRLRNSAGIVGATGLAAAAAQLDERPGTDPAEVQPYDRVAVTGLSVHWKLTRAAIGTELEITAPRPA